MHTRPLSEDDRRRLAAERAAADRRYNDALTAVDRASRSGPAALPDAPAPIDERQIADINDRWKVVVAPAPAPGWRGRAAGFVWRVVAPLFERQQQFNAALVEHVNRNIDGDRRARAVQAEITELLRDHLGRLATFESQLVQFLQQITAYVDTKDAAVAADALAAPHEQARALEQTIALVQQQVAALKREFERAAAIGEPERVREGSGGPERPALRTDPALRTVRSAGLSGPRSADLEAYKYVGFEHEFRGDERQIRARLEGYAALFAGATDVLDAGCGRGEFLDVLRARGVQSRGVELNHEMVERCRALGLQVEEADAVGYLERLPDGALGGLFAAQVVEHLEPAYLMRFLALAYEKLRPGSRIVLETINVDCWAAFFGPYLRDITHVRPLPPETLGYLLRASGFQRVETRAGSPVDETVKLRRVETAAVSDASARAVAEALNANVDALNGLLFTHMDYAAVAERL